MTSDSYAYCEKMAREHYENFPVGSLLIPKARRKHVYSIYAFARTADDFADEGYEDGSITRSKRLSDLDDWEQQLDDCYEGNANHEIFRALGATVRELNLPRIWFKDLISAFKQDVVKTRYENFDELIDYSRRSANPVGRLILALFGYRDEHRQMLSDNICTALQLANFWQDVSVDILKDRIYLPVEDMKRFGVTEEDLRKSRYSKAYAELLKCQTERTKQLFIDGKELPRIVRGRLSVELKLTWHGGMRILHRIEEQNFDTLTSRPKITTSDKMMILVRSLFN